MVRLPFAHCTLNPIEFAWAQVKDHIKANTRAFNLREVEQLAWECFDVHFEDHYWSNDGLYEELVDEFIIQVGDE